MIDHTSIYIFMFFLVALPGLYFVAKSALFNKVQEDQYEDENGNIRHVDISKTVSALNTGVGLLHDRAPLLVDMPIDSVAQIIGTQLTSFHFCNASWRIVNIDSGTPTTISANIPCLDERDVNFAVRMDLGVLITIDENATAEPTSVTSVKLRFIPYEGPHKGLEEIADLTEKYLAGILCAPQINQSPAAIISAAPYVVPEASAMASASAEVVSPESLPDQLFQNTFKNDAALEYQQSASARQAEAAYESFEATVDGAAASGVPNLPVIPVNPIIPDVPAATPRPEPPAMPAFDFTLPVSTASTASTAFTSSPTAAPAPASADAQPGLCPGCSQPINPSFPFCLYCSRNF